MGTRGTKTFKYPQEKKSIEIPLLAASERGTGQTESHGDESWEMWCVDPAIAHS